LGGLFGDKAKHNAQAEWLIDEMSEMEDKNKDIWEDIKTDIITETTKKLANWKAPGPDRVQNFWIKHLKSLHLTPTEMYNSTITNPHKAPLWLTEGQTTLIYEKGDTFEAKKISLITCLPTYFKLITLLISDIIYQHLDANNILPIE